MRTVIREVSNCGTYGGYNTHIQIGEKPCDSCREARNAYIRDYRRRKGLTKSTLVPVEMSCPNCGHHIAEGAA